MAKAPQGDRPEVKAAVQAKYIFFTKEPKENHMLTARYSIRPLLISMQCSCVLYGKSILIIQISIRMGIGEKQLFLTI